VPDLKKHHVKLKTDGYRTNAKGGRTNIKINNKKILICQRGSLIFDVDFENADELQNAVDWNFP
jgi:hypothetical protein